MLLPTFPILRAGESHYREKATRKFPKLAETSSFLIESGPTPRVFFPELRPTKGTDRRLALDLCKVGFAQRPHCRRHGGRPGNKSGSTDPQDGDRCKTCIQSLSPWMIFSAGSADGYSAAASPIPGKSGWGWGWTPDPIGAAVAGSTPTGELGRVPLRVAQSIKMLSKKKGRPIPGKSGVGPPPRAIPGKSGVGVGIGGSVPWGFLPASASVTASR